MAWFFADRAIATSKIVMAALEDQSGKAEYVWVHKETCRNHHKARLHE